MRKNFSDGELAAARVAVWGWHIPVCKDQMASANEAQLVARIADEFDLDGVLIDAEQGAQYFKGTPAEATIYSQAVAEAFQKDGRGLALSSHDIVDNFPQFPFQAFIDSVQFNAPQVYYGGSTSVDSRLSRALIQNERFDKPIVPVGAAWIGPNGGCASSSACAERAREFMRLVRDNKLPAYSFWHWMGAPTKFWEVLALVEP